VITLKKFQEEAADQIAARFQEHHADPPWNGGRKTGRPWPFYQALSSITASGKTAMLADAVSSIAVELQPAPLVLWLSKGRIVVEQSFEALSPGGKYHHLLGNAHVNPLAQYDADEVRGATLPLVYLATVGTFNQRDRERGDRLIFRSEIDTAETSTWEAIKARTDDQDLRRPLVVVYDEGHNLSDQQMDLLLELQPDALITASATMRHTARLGEVIHALKAAGRTDADLITEIDAAAVVDEGLVKTTIALAGYQAPMEETIDSLLEDMEDATALAHQHGIGKPKAAYVCRTNIVEGNAQQQDDPRQPFSQRKAPPILIWRYLVEQHGVDPDAIAVYLDLKTNKDFPLPDGFHVFKGGEKDYTEFSAGGFRHIIFNLGLQEGWDDPLCYFAYIDKSMESSAQVEQTVGRLLRQPDATRLPVERLNTAHVYIRVDRRGVFTAVLDAVNDKLRAEGSGIRIINTPPGKPKPVPLPPRTKRQVYTTAYMPEHAVAKVQALMDEINDYRTDDGTNTRSAGARAIVQRLVASERQLQFQWETFEHTNLVSARWLLQREISRRYPGALGIVSLGEAKLDALTGIGSNAAKQLSRIAEQIVDVYLNEVYLKQKRVDPYDIGPIMTRTDEMIPFTNSIHEGYSDLNSLEESFAYALDATGLTWCRNPSRSGYCIPLVSLGRTSNFFPDFLAWQGEHVLAIDTTAPHLLADKAARKLLSIIPPTGASGRLYVRFISEGTHADPTTQVSPAGYTVWGLKPDGELRATHVDSLQEAVERTLVIEGQ
jgi:type III restriction enzyme